MSDDDVKKLILARRAKFVAAALVGLSAARCGGETASNSSGGNPQPCLTPVCDADCNPQPCLTQAIDASNDGSIPQPCLSPQPDDAGDAGDAGDADPDADDGG